MADMRLKSPCILCTGIAVRDLIFLVPAPPDRGAKINASEFLEISGGNASNAAIALAKLGAAVRYAGPLGDDNNGRAIRADLVALGIDCVGCSEARGAMTPLSAILIDAAGERTVTTYRDPRISAVAPADPERLLRNVAVVCADNRLPAFSGPICTAARARNIPVVLDGDRAMDAVFLDHANYIVFSTEGLAATTGLSDPVKGLKAFADRSPAFVAVTRGADGVTWLDAKRDVHHLPGFPITAVDTLGAGDVFHGAFALAIGEGQHIEAAMRFATAAAALKCTRIGGAFATPTRAAVDALLASVGPAHP